MGRGTDIAMEVAMVTLMNSDLLLVPRAYKLSRDTVRAIPAESFLGVCLQCGGYSDRGRSTLPGMGNFAQSDVGQCCDGFQFGVSGAEQPAAPVEIANERHCGCRG